MENKSNLPAGLGYVIVFLGILLVVAYAYFLFFSPWTFQTMQVTFIAIVAAIGGVICWIGYTLTRASKTN